MLRKEYLIIKVIMLALIVIVLPSGCENQQKVRNKSYETIKSLEYSYGSYFGGYYEFQLFYEDDIPYITAKGNNGVELSYKQEITKEEVVSLENTLKDHKVEMMDGFHERDASILDGYDFVLFINYATDGLSSSGYMKYPKNYSEIHDILTDFFFDIIETYTTFDRNYPMEKTSAYDEFAFLGVPVTASPISNFSLSYSYVGKESLVFCYDNKSEVLFDVSYYSNVAHEVEDYSWQCTKIDTIIRLSDLSKLEERIKEHGLFSYSGYYDRNLWNSDYNSKLRTEITVLYEDGTEIEISYIYKMLDRFSGWEDDFMKEIEELFGVSITDYIELIHCQK